MFLVLQAKKFVIIRKMLLVSLHHLICLTGLTKTFPDTDKQTFTAETYEEYNKDKTVRKTKNASIEPLLLKRT